MGALFRSEELCLVQIFLQSGSAYNCVSELGELGVVEFRDLNPHVNSFQRKFVNEVRRCEEMEKTFSDPVPSAPQPRDLLAIEEESERLATELKQVCVHSELALVNTICGNCRRKAQQVIFVYSWIFCGPSFFVAGVVHPWKVPAFERLLWRACRGYFIIEFQEMEKNPNVLETSDMTQWTVFLISFWGKTIGQKVKKICDCFHANTFFYPENTEERQELQKGLQSRIEDITQVLFQTESYLQQLLCRCVSILPQWKVCVMKCKAVHSILNMCSASVTDKCLIAEAWCPVRKLLLLQSALTEGTRRSGSIVDSFYNRLPLSSSSSPPTLFTTNSFTAVFQSLVDAYGVAKYGEVNPAAYTIVTFPFLFAVMFGDVGHGLLMVIAALWMILQNKDNKNTHFKNEMWRTVLAGRYLILSMGLFSVYTGAIYNHCFSRTLSIFPSSWHLRPMNWSDDTLRGSRFLCLDPNTTGVFRGPYPLGIDPIWHLASNHLTFLNSYKMKMSIIIGVLHMTFGICISYFNYSHSQQWFHVLLVLIPELLFMLGLFGYLVFLIIYKWLAFGPGQSDRAPSILLHFINMVLFTDNKETPPLYPGQVTHLQSVLMVVVLTSVPVLLLGRPIYLYYHHTRHQNMYLLNSLEHHSIRKQLEFDAVEVFMHQAIHTMEYCLGCISNTASYLRLWALSLAHAQLSDVLWMMVMRTSLSSRGMLGSVVLAGFFSFFALLTVSILLVMEGLSASLHTLRLHWVEFQSKFYSGTGYKFSPFSFTSITNPL
uniref:V-type proton ATPase subunit a n=1 Tax=Sphaeramia orbicularis TaxID=375764 RepID=A0A672YL47_9TELE